MESPNFVHSFCTYIYRLLENPLSQLGMVDPPMTYQEAQAFLAKAAEAQKGEEPTINRKKISEIFQEQVGAAGPIYLNFGLCTPYLR